MFDIDQDAEVVSVLRSAYIVAREVSNQKELMTALNHLESALDVLIAKYGDDFLKSS